MEYVQTRDILRKAADFHKQLSTRYSMECSKFDGSRVQMLLNYLSRHERNLAELVERCSEDACPSIINTWFKYTPDSLTELMTKEFHIPADSTTEDVIDIALDMDNHLIEFYDDAANRAIYEEVREFFENLRDQEEQDGHRLVRNTLSEQ